MIEGAHVVSLVDLFRHDHIFCSPLGEKTILTRISLVSLFQLSETRKGQPLLCRGAGPVDTGQEMIERNGGKGVGEKIWQLK